MTKIEPKELGKLFEARRSTTTVTLDREASGRAAALSRVTAFSAFGREADALFAEAVSIPRAPVGSWIRGVPLPAMLAAKRRLTVDVTPDTLADFGASYNLSPSAFIDLASAGVLLVNIRDYDPSSDKAERALASYADADETGFLPNLLEHAGDHVYFIADLRRDLFNPLFPDGGSLSKSHEEAGKLAPAAEAAAKLGPYSELVRKAVFRNERPAFNAVRWHWAYAQAVKRFSRQLDPEIAGGIDKEFDLIVNGSSSDKAADYLDLATRLRYSHLLISAPVSASFGGVYNLLLDGEAEFLQAVRFGGRLADYDYVDDRLLDTIRSLQLGRLPAYVAAQVPRRMRPSLNGAGIQVFAHNESSSYLKFYENGDNRKALIAYVVEADGLEGREAKVDADIDALLTVASPSLSAVASIADESRSIAEARGKRLARLTNGHSSIEMPSAELLSLPSTPIYEANPKVANLLLNATKTSDRRPSIGQAGDSERRTVWFPRVFRRPPH